MQAMTNSVSSWWCIVQAKPIQSAYASNWHAQTNECYATTECYVRQQFRIINIYKVLYTVTAGHIAVV